MILAHLGSVCKFGGEGRALGKRKEEREMEERIVPQLE